jgi:hypothetical protein
LTVTANLSKKTFAKKKTQNFNHLKILGYIKPIFWGVGNSHEKCLVQKKKKASQSKKKTSAVDLNEEDKIRIR